MTLKEFISTYSVLGAEGTELSIDKIIDMVEAYTNIIIPDIKDEQAKVPFGNCFIQGMFCSALFDSNNGKSSEFDNFIIKNCADIMVNYEKKHFGEGQSKLLQ